MDLFFEPPWYLIVGLLLAGVVLLYHGLSRQLAGLRWAGIAALVLATAAIVAGRFVETGPERVTRQTRELVEAADRHDWTAFARHLDPQVRLSPIYAGKEELTRGAERTIDKVGVKNISLGSFDVKPDPGGYQVAFTATADIEITARRTPTDWKFYWAENRAGGDYLLYKIEVLPNAQLGTDPVMTRLTPP